MNSRAHPKYKTKYRVANWAEDDRAWSVGGSSSGAPTSQSRRRRIRSPTRDRTINRVRIVGRRRWKKGSGYHQQARVEDGFFSFKSIIGDRLRDRHPRAQRTEALIACNILNRMTGLGRPASYSIDA